MFKFNESPAIAALEAAHLESNCTDHDCWCHDPQCYSEDYEPIRYEADAAVALPDFGW